MPLQRGIAGVAAALLFAIGVAAALAAAAFGYSPSTTTVATTTSEPTTTAPATTSTLPTTTATTTTTATPATTASTTTVASTTSTVITTPISSRSPRAATPARQLSLSRCSIAAVVLFLPHRGPMLIGAVADARSDTAELKRLVYPSGGSVATASAATLDEGACPKDGPEHADAHLRSVSLFGGAVTATLVTLTLRNRVSTSIAGLVIDGKHLFASSGTSVPLRSWGYAIARPRTPVHLPGGGTAIAAIAVHLIQTRAGLPAGTVVLVAVAAVSSRQVARALRQTARTSANRHRKQPRARHKPLKVTPPLSERQYIFPVAGPSDYVDTYGAFRSDVPGKWHHGDDIFAPLGTPVVAVASGTINRVGWEKLGGWRVWVRDSVGNEFYYAHLAGYAPTDLHSNRVHAGQVIGFIGNTGDAFTTSPHLHFEIHPRPLLHLGYDGAVDPTTYLDHWTHAQHVDVPRPVHPPLPEQPPLRKEARYVFRELLAARHLLKHAPKPSQPPHIPVPAGAIGPPLPTPAALRESSPRLPTEARPAHTVAVAALVAGLGALALAGTAMLQWFLRRRRRVAPPRSDEAV